MAFTHTHTLAQGRKHALTQFYNRVLFLHLITRQLLYSFLCSVSLEIAAKIAAKIASVNGLIRQVCVVSD